jgi:hypothetical protein
LQEILVSQEQMSVAFVRAAIERAPVSHTAPV